MSIIRNCSLTRGDIRALGNNLSDAICDRSAKRRRHALKMLRALDAYLAALRAQSLKVVQQASVALKGVPAHVGGVWESHGGRREIGPTTTVHFNPAARRSQ